MDTRDYPRYPVEPPRPQMPTWAVVLMTLAVVVNLIGWPLAAWGYWHG